jgi:hypothetical protein
VNTITRSITTNIRRAAAIVALGLAACVPAAAQSNYVKGHTSVMGVPGGYTHTVGPVSAITPLAAAAEAGGWYNNAYGSLYAWASGTATSGEGGTNVVATVAADRGNATWYSGNPSCQSHIKYTDQLLITSSTLPAGTPVQIVIDPNAGMSITGTGAFSGSIQTVLSASGKISSNQYAIQNGTVRERRDGAIVIDTKVGWRVYMELSTTAYGAAMYAYNGFFGGNVTTQASTNIKITVNTPGAGYVAASGRTY